MRSLPWLLKGGLTAPPSWWLLFLAGLR